MKKKFRLLKCINGYKGAIALFMTVLMTPFLSIAMMLIETGRYNSAVSILDEAMGTSATSTLANMDSYLHERWGLLAVTQDKDINTLYSQYLTTNSGVLGNSLMLNNINATGMYSLSEGDILYNQILEYSKLNAPTMLASNFLNIADLIEGFENIGHIRNIFSIIGSSAGAMESVVDLAEQSEELKNYANELDMLQDSYEREYGEFEGAVNNLINGLKEPEPELKPNPTKPTEPTKPIKGNGEGAEEEYKKAMKDYNKAMEDYSEELEDYNKELKEYNEALEEYNRYHAHINELRNAASTAKGEYQNQLNSVLTKFEAYNTAVKERRNSISTLVSETSNIVSNTVEIDNKQDKLEETKKKIENMEAQGIPDRSKYQQEVNKSVELENELSEYTMKANMTKATADGVKDTEENWNKTFNKNSDESLRKFRQINNNLSSFNIANIQSNSSVQKENYYQPLQGLYANSDEIDEFLKNQSQEFVSGSFSSFIKSVTSFIESIFQTSLFYESELSAVIDVNYYQEKFGGLPGAGQADHGVIAIIRGIGNLSSEMINFKTGISNPLNWVNPHYYITLVNQISSIINITVALFNEIINFAVGIIENITSLFTSYDRLYYTTYSTFNLPCRTDLETNGISFSGLTGYELSLPQKGIELSLPVIGGIVAMVDTINDARNGTGTDLTFSGAELEYVLCGSNSEIANQLYVFCALYIVRLLLDLPAVTTNVEVQTLAAASTFGYPVIMALEILLEPLIDVILLVNGSSIALYDSSVYLTPTGLPQLIEKFVSVVYMRTEDKQKAESSLKNALGVSEEQYNQKKQEYSKKPDVSKPSKPENNSKVNKVWSNYKEGLISFNYREYCFFLMLLTVRESEQIARLKNLIQMETLYYYQQEGVLDAYDLRKSYTFIDAKVDVGVKQMLPSLADSSLFTIKRQQYRGY